MPFLRRPARRELALTLPVLGALIGGLAMAWQAAAQQPGRPGDFDYYALVLSWSPTYCADVGDGRNDPQCSVARPYAFVMHGLWPQFSRGWPEGCRTEFNPRVPRPLVDSMLDIMPSPNLISHEYRKHGTCSGLEPEGYFKLARQIYDKVRIPGPYRQPDRPVSTTPRQMVAEFVAANPGLKPEMMGVACGRPNRLREVRICFTRSGEFKTCGSNEDQGRLCRSSSVVLPPVRGGSGAAERSGRPGSRGNPLPGPDRGVPATGADRRI